MADLGSYLTKHAEPAVAGVILALAGAASAIAAEIRMPATSLDEAAGAVNADGDTARPFITGGANQIRIFHSHSAEYHPANPPLEPSINGRHIANAAAQLNGNIRRAQDCFDRRRVHWLAFKRAI